MMKLLSVQLARTIWTLDLAEVNPRGKNIFSDLVPKLIQEFKFKKSPEEGGDFSKGLVFTLGSFMNRNDDDVAVGITIFSDGVSADTYSSTDDSDEFLDVVSEILPQIGYSFDPEMVQRKAYNSQIVVRSEVNLSLLNPLFDKFAEKLSELSDPRVDFGFAAIEFWPDQTQTFKPVNFSLQRKNGTAFSDNRYWSQAGMPTQKHLEFLEELETTLS
jgi:hypothetical protein